MGSAIAFLVATKTKAAVSLFDISPEALKKAEAGIEKMGKSSVDKGFLTQDELADARKRITTGCDLKAAATANLVIEAIAENLEAKQNLLESWTVSATSKRYSHPTPLLCRSPASLRRLNGRISLSACTFFRPRTS